jgi:DNA-binding protein H-NS
MDISSLSLAELKQLQKQIPAEIVKREDQEKKKVLDEVRALAEARGFSIDQLIGGAKETKVRVSKPLSVKYRHPENQALTWTGRGRKPQGVEAWIGQGRKIEELAV